MGNLITSYKSSNKNVENYSAQRTDGYRPESNKKSSRYIPSRGRRPRNVNISQGASNLENGFQNIILPPEFNDKLKIIPLGGLEEVGRNMMVIEYEDDIVIIDMGFQFPEENTPGINYIIPNIKYLQGKEKNIRGVIITHGHNDHMGAIPHLIGKLGNPPIYTAPLSAALIQKRHEEFALNSNDKLNIILVDKNDARLPLGRSFIFQTFHVNHNISDSFGVALTTPCGTILHTGDFKFDFTPVNDTPADLRQIALWGGSEVLLLMSDSTSADKPGNQISELRVGEELDSIISKAEGRVIVATFSSLLSRIQQVIHIAEKYNRKILLEGRSLIKTVEICHQLGYLKFKPGTLIEEEEFKHLPDNRLIVVCTGAQGEKYAVFMRMAMGEHRFLFIKKGDTVIFSSSVIAGNERSIQSIKDRFCRDGAHIIHYANMDVHAGGHAKQEDLKLMLRLVQPKYFIPIHGNRFLLQAHAELASTAGVKPENIFIPDNGQIVAVDTNQNMTMSHLKVPTDYVMVDGIGVGDVSSIVLRDRIVLSEDGMFVIIVTLDTRTGKLLGNPDIISRGFIFLKENKELIEKTRMRVKRMFKDCNLSSPTFENDMKNQIRLDISKWLFTQTERRPMVLPVLIQV